MDFRFQLLHEVACTNTIVSIFVVASTKTEYVVIGLFPEETIEDYKKCLSFVKSEHLRWMFSENDIQKFDYTLSNIPTFSDVSYGYAADLQIVKCCLQLMMQLHKLCDKLGSPIPPGSHLIPSVIGLWNVMKGAIDDLSKVLAHNLAKWGPLALCTVLVLRVFSSQLYSAWRLYALQCVQEFLEERCSTYQSYLHEHQRKGGTFEAFLEQAFHTMTLPTHLPSENIEFAVKNGTPYPPRPIGRHLGRLRFNSPEWRAFRINGIERPGDHKHVQVSLSEFYRTDRSYCVFCSKTEYNNEKGAGCSICLYGGGLGRRPCYGCLKCQVPLCRHSPDSTGRSCFVKWHTNQKIWTTVNYHVSPKKKGKSGSDAQDVGSDEASNRTDVSSGRSLVSSVTMSSQSSNSQQE